MTLVLDTGDLFPPVLGPQAALKAEVIARAYGLMRYDAVSIGETDLMHGVERLRNLVSELGIPAVCANLTAAYGDSSHCFPQYFMKDIAGIKVAVIGLLNHKVPLPVSVADSVRISPMNEELARILPSIRENADVVILLAHSGSFVRARQLALEFDGLDVVVAGHPGPVEPEPEQMNDALIVYVRRQGRYMGRLNLLLDEKHKVIGFGHETVPISPEIPHDPQLLKLLAEYIDRLKILVASTAFRPTEKDLREPAAHYVTAAACAECHSEQYAQWMQTGHATAFESIVKRSRDFDPECQKCHTTGFLYRTGFITPRGTPQLKNVQCEACHGPGDTHRSDPTAGYGGVTKEGCLVCHTTHNSPEFDYEKYLEKVRH